MLGAALKSYCIAECQSSVSGAARDIHFWNVLGHLQEIDFSGFLMSKVNTSEGDSFKSCF